MPNDFLAFLPEDHACATLLARVWQPEIAGPAIAVIEDGEVYDISDTFPLMSEALNALDPVARVRSISHRRHIGSVAQTIRNTLETEPREHTHFLAPADLQSLKACGVTFVDSLLERVIEERCGGDPQQINLLRETIRSQIGEDLRTIRPNSPASRRVKALLLERDLWSQYLEVGIGEHAEVFTKSQPMSAVGLGACIGLLRGSTWNNPEPEVVLAINAAGTIVGCTLGNDVNLRDFEGRSALLLGVSKDNNASCAVGPFIRLLDDDFTLQDLKRLRVTLTITGDDNFSLEGSSDLADISRDVEDLTAQVIGEHHQYPDGLLLFTGTMFVPIQDRDTVGGGFTHKLNDIVRISSPQLGTLLNRVGYADEVPPWSFGLSALMRNLHSRGLL